MTTLRTTARLTLAALSVGLGSTLANAADKKPIKPVAPPVVKKPNGWSLGASNPTVVNKPHAPAIDVTKKPNGWSFPASTGWSLGASNPTVKSARDLDGQSAGTERTKKPEQGRPSGFVFSKIEYNHTKSHTPTADGTKRPKPSNLGDTGTHEVGHVKNPKLDPKNVKPISSGGGVAVQNDAGTRSGASLAGEGVIDITKGFFQVISPKGDTHKGLKTIAEGARKVQTGTNGDPADNGDKLTEEGKGDGENSGGGNSNGGSGGGSNGGGSSGSGSSGSGQ